MFALYMTISEYLQYHHIGLLIITAAFVYLFIYSIYNKQMFMPPIFFFLYALG
jgi:hypothetical protein